MTGLQIQSLYLAKGLHTHLFGAFLIINGFVTPYLWAKETCLHKGTKLSFGNMLKLIPNQDIRKRKTLIKKAPRISFSFFGRYFLFKTVVGFATTLFYFLTLTAIK